MHLLYEIEKKWENTSAHHLIATAQVQREQLIAACGEDFLHACNARFSAHDTVLHAAWIEVILIIGGTRCYLKNTGYTEFPVWRLEWYKEQKHKIFRGVEYFMGNEELAKN